MQFVGIQYGMVLLTVVVYERNTPVSLLRWTESNF